MGVVLDPPSKASRLYRSPLCWVRGDFLFEKEHHLLGQVRTLLGEFWKVPEETKIHERHVRRRRCGIWQPNIHVALSSSQIIQAGA